MSEFEHVQQSLRNVYSARVNFLKITIDYNAYEYRRALISVTISFDSTEMCASQKAALKR